MSRIYSFVALLGWSLWLGGLITLFISVTTLFRRDHALAQQAAPHLFLVFEQYQLILAAVALTSTFAWRLSSRIMLLNMMFLMLALAALGAVASPMYFTKRMESLREQGRTNSPEFRKLHGQSMGVYTGEAVLLLIGGLILFAALKKPASPAAPEVKSA